MKGKMRDFIVKILHLPMFASLLHCNAMCQIECDMVGMFLIVIYMCLVASVLQIYPTMKDLCQMLNLNNVVLLDMVKMILVIGVMILWNRLIRSHDVEFIEDQTIENIDKVEWQSSSPNSDLIEVYPILITDGDIREGTSQQDEEHEDVGEMIIVDDRVYVSYDVVLPKTSFEQGRQRPF